MSKRALNRAKKAVGSQSKLARLLGITRQAVDQWKKVPPLKVLAVERVSGVSRYELRPDLYPLDD